MKDSLTGLPDRVALRKRLTQAVGLARRDGQPFALLIMDLNGLKEVNQIFGHQYGDRLIQQVGSRLRAVRRESDVVARVGDDEFALILPNTDLPGVTSTLRKIQSAIKAAFVVDDLKLSIRASLGVALYPQHGKDADVLFQHADVALHVAKRINTDYVLYDHEHDPYSPLRYVLIDDLRRAINQDQLVLHYQPKVNVRTGTSEQVEALVRWQHPERGIVAPNHFIGLAEETGLIEPLTRWVVRAALQQSCTWQKQGMDVGVAVNLSAANLSDPDLVDVIASTLRSCDLPGRALDVEITEGTVMANPVEAMKFLTRLQDLGVRASIDDFGTGYSSLAYLKQLPVDEIKIDRSFVTDMATSDNDAIIVRSVIDLGHNLGLQVIAEGVENQAAWGMLRTQGCDLAQGYYFSRPLPAGEVTSWLQSSRMALN